MFRFTFLGTSSGLPTKERNVSALALECLTYNEKAKNHPWLLIDCGEGTQQQLLKSALSTANLSAILITHVHGDHCYGLVGLLASMGMYGRKTPLTIIAPQAIFEMLDTLQRLTQWYINYPIDCVVIETLLQNKTTQLCEHHLVLDNEHKIHIQIYELSHRCASYGFKITQHLFRQNLNTLLLKEQSIDKSQWRYIIKAKDEPVLKIDEKNICPKDFIINRHETLSVVVAGDNDEPALLAGAVKNAKVLVHEATYTDDVRQKILTRPVAEGGFDPKHSSSKMVAQFAQNVALPALILTHFSARYALYEDETSVKPNMAHIRAEAKQHYDGQIILAKDFLQVVVDDKGARVVDVA